MRRLLLGLALIFLVLTTTWNLYVNSQETPGQQVKPKQESDKNSESTPQIRESIERGIKWIVKNQNAGKAELDGSFGCEKGEKPSVALTSLAILVLLADSNTPERGRYKDVIQKGIKWISTQAINKKGFNAASDSSMLGAVFEHASATLMWATIYGLMENEKKSDINNFIPKETVKINLDKCIAILQELQNTSDGWAKEAAKGYWADNVVTTVAYLGLATGYHLGRSKNDKANRDLCLEITKSRCTGENQGYSGITILNESTYLRIAYGMDKIDEKVLQTTKLMTSQKFNSTGNVTEWDYMGSWMSTGAMFIASDRRPELTASYNKWYNYSSDFLMKLQKKEGYWVIEDCIDCKMLATTLALLSMLTPTKILPYQYY